MSEVEITYSTAACTLEHLSKEVSSRLKVCRPAKPATVTSVKVEPDVILLQL